MKITLFTFNRVCCNKIICRDNFLGAIDRLLTLTLR